MQDPRPTRNAVAMLVAGEASSLEDGPLFTRVSGFAQATPDSIVYATDKAALTQAIASPAGLILAPASLAQETAPDARLLFVRNPRLAFAQVHAHWFQVRPVAGIHPTAVVEPSARLGANCSVGPRAYVGEGVVLGEECVLGPGVAVLAGTTLGTRVRVQAGAVLGADGFGYVRGSAGYVMSPQIGTLVLEDDVEIGANTTVDRGALGETRICQGAKLDNLVHIAHNCRVGRHVVIAAQTGVAGSTVIEDDAVIGGQVGLGDHVVIGAGVVLGSGSGVLPHKKLRGAGQVFWGTPAQPVLDYLRGLARLRRG